jgi:UDP-N-acetyl-D-mannosaminuronic acid dehydrogenase
LDSLVEGSDVVDLASDFVRTARQINESMPTVTCELVRSALERTGRGEDEITALVLGTAFKGRPATNDTRNTPAKPIIDELVTHGRVNAYDPHVEDHKIVELGATPVEAAELEELFDEETYDVIVVANDNPAFRDLDLSYAVSRMAPDPILIDGWGTFDPKTATRLGFEYRLVGGGNPD